MCNDKFMADITIYIKPYELSLPSPSFRYLFTVLDGP